MAKEGFDWIWCEHALTVGYRSSLTEIVQIIGRATRDAPGKDKARFTNLIAEPDAAEAAVVDAINDTLKAIAASLLMEQVLAPRFEFTPYGILLADPLEPGARHLEDVVVVDGVGVVEGTREGAGDAGDDGAARPGADRYASGQRKGRCGSVRERGHHRITIDPAVCGGRPCIRGLRIRVKDVLDLLAAGATRDEILEDYPYLEPDDVTAVLEFAALQNNHPVLRSA
jgi:uncharacterized protein (DUF433 family)